MNTVEGIFWRVSDDYHIQILSIAEVQYMLQSRSLKTKT